MCRSRYNGPSWTEDIRPITQPVFYAGKKVRDQICSYHHRHANRYIRLTCLRVQEPDLPAMQTHLNVLSSGSCFKVVAAESRPNQTLVVVWTRQDTSCSYLRVLQGSLLVVVVASHESHMAPCVNFLAFKATRRGGLNKEYSNYGHHGTCLAYTVHGPCNMELNPDERTYHHSSQVTSDNMSYDRDTWSTIYLLLPRYMVWWSYVATWYDSQLLKKSRPWSGTHAKGGDTQSQERLYKKDISWRMAQHVQESKSDKHIPGRASEDHGQL